MDLTPHQYVVYMVEKDAHISDQFGEAVTTVDEHLSILLSLKEQLPRTKSVPNSQRTLCKNCAHSVDALHSASLRQFRAWMNCLRAIQCRLLKVSVI